MSAMDGGFSTRGGFPTRLPEARPKLGVLGALVLAVCLPAFAQPNKSKQPKAPAAKVLPKSEANQRAKAPARIPDAQVNRLMNMKPEEREKVLANLPPERREKLMDQLERLDRLTPAQKQQLNWRFQELQKLPPVRRQAVRAELQTLRDLRPAPRRLRVLSPEFREQYSPEEIQLMKDVYGIP